MKDQSRLREYYAGLTDEDLLSALNEGEHAYEPHAWQVITSETTSRGLSAVAGSGPAKPEVNRVQELVSQFLKNSDAPEAPLPETTLEEVEESLRAARKQSKAGSFWVLGGIAVTVGSWVAATEAGGGTYLVGWGAIVYGALQATRGERRAKELIRLRQRLEGAA
jgi:hypothetical protein